MLQFIISGRVPGTDIQITFEQLANLLGAFAVVYLFWVLYKEQRIIRDAYRNAQEYIEQVTI